MIRRRLTAGEIAAAAGTLDANATLTDIVGTVRSVDVGHVVVDTRRGEVRVAITHIVTAKALGPRPGRRGAPHRAVSVEDLEELMTDGWPPHEREWFGRWMLRAAGGYTGRANSALVLGEPGPSTADALATVRRWYDARALPPLIQVPLSPGFSADDDPLVQEATTLGWEALRPVRVMTAASADVAAAARRTSTSSMRTNVSPTLDDAWWSLADDRARTHESDARRVLEGSEKQVFLALTPPVDTDGITSGAAGAPSGAVAHARLALSPGWAGVFALATRPDARRQGLARQLLRACADEALRADEASMYLQVAADNAPAIALYESLGFTTHHRYVYLQPN